VDTDVSEELGRFSSEELELDLDLDLELELDLDLDLELEEDLDLDFDEELDGIPRGCGFRRNILYIRYI
jgi:hypothetical protein